MILLRFYGRILGSLMSLFRAYRCLSSRRRPLVLIAILRPRSVLAMRILASIVSLSLYRLIVRRVLLCRRILLLFLRARLSIRLRSLGGQTLWVCLPARCGLSARAVLVAISSTRGPARSPPRRLIRLSRVCLLRLIA